MKLTYFIFFSLVLTFLLEARERRKVDDDALRPTQIVIVEYGDPEVEYTVMSKSRELQRQALLAFKLQQFDDAQSCYSLALNAAPNSKDIIVEYIFCSLLVPITSKAYSLKRAERLMEHLENIEGQSMERYGIAKALIYVAKNQITEGLAELSKVKSRKYSKVVESMQQDIEAGKTFHHDLLEKLLPVRLAPREKRSNRR